MSKVIANMVVRNEAGNYLTQVLERLSTQVDEIILTDDCSDDNTADIAESLGAKVQRLDEPMFSVHEGALRQKSWDWLEQHITDPDTLVLAIDADEELYETQFKLRDMINFRQYSVFNVMFFHMWNEKQFRVDGGWRPHQSTRLFRYLPGGRFSDRRMACGSEPTYVVDMVRNFRLAQENYMYYSGLLMKHLSYIKDEDKVKKFERYTALDGGAFHAGAHIMSIMDPPEKVELHEWEGLVS